MCLLIYKPLGVGYGKISSAIRNGARSNRHSFGYALKRNGQHKIIINKDFKNCEEMIKELEEQKIQFGDELMVHLRLATHGEICPENAHPYVISRNSIYFWKKGGSSAFPVIGHNGILRGFGDDKLSDTYDFVLRILAEPNVLSALLLDPEAIFNTPEFKKMLTWDRFCILFPNRQGFWSGDKILYEGVYYSNSGFKGEGIPETSATPTTQTSLVLTGEAADKARTMDDNYLESTSDTRTKISINRDRIHNGVIPLHSVGRRTCKKYVRSMINGAEAVSTLQLEIDGAGVQRDNTNIEEFVRPYLSDELEFNLTTTQKFSLETMKALLERLSILKDLLGHKYAYSDMIVSNVFEIDHAMRLIHADLRNRLNNIAYGRFLAELPVKSRRTASVMAEENNPRQFPVNALTAKGLNSECHMLICTTSSNICMRGDKFVLASVTDKSVIMIQTGTESVMVHTVLLSALCGNFNAVYDPEAIKAEKNIIRLKDAKALEHPMQTAIDALE